MKIIILLLGFIALLVVGNYFLNTPIHFDVAYMTADEACTIFNNTGIFNHPCPYETSKINNYTFFTPKYCDISERIDRSKAPFIYFKSSYLDSLSDSNDLRLVYCEVTSEAAPKVYRYVRINWNITHLFFANPACRDHSIYLLPKTTNNLGEIIKDTYSTEIKNNSLTIDLEQFPTSLHTIISVRENDILIGEEKLYLTCG